MARIKKPLSIRIISSIVAIVLLWQNMTFCAPERTSTLRPPSYLKSKNRIFTTAIAYRLKSELKDPSNDLEDSNSLIKAIKVSLEDKLNELGVRLIVDSFSRPWIFCEEADIYLYIQNDKGKTVVSSKVEELIRVAKAKTLARLMGVFSNEDILRMIKHELLFMAQQPQQEPSLVIGPVIRALADPSPKCVKYAEEFLLEVSEIHPELTTKLLGGALSSPKHAGRAKKLFLKIAKTKPDLVIYFLQGILKKDKRKAVQEATTEMIESIRCSAGYATASLSTIGKPKAIKGNSGRGKRDRRPPEYKEGKGSRVDGKRYIIEEIIDYAEELKKTRNVLCGNN